MSRLFLASVMMISMGLAAATAQDKDKKEPTKDGYKKEVPKVSPLSKLAPAIPGDVEIYFLNGSKVRMIVQSESVEIATLYGKLSVPVRDVRGIEFGLHFPEGVEDKIAAAIKSLGSSDYRTRENGGKALQDLAPYSYPFVLEASRTKDLEIASRAKDIVAKLIAKHPKKDLKTMVEDRVMTNAFTIVGRIQTTTIKAKVENFGEHELVLAKMRSLRAMGGGSADTDISVDAGKYANAGQWLDTQYIVDGRTAITITAKGIIDVWPQQGGQFMSNPNGFNATRGNGGVIRGRINGGVNQNQHCGMLVGKIGESGEMFTVGERYDGSPEVEGNLFLHIGPSQWNVQSSGSYDVKIGRKSD